MGKDELSEYYPSAVDALAKEVRMWVFNEESLYKRLEALAEDYARKKLRGRFDKAKAIKGIVTVLVKPTLTFLRKKGYIEGWVRVSKNDKWRIAELLWPTVEYEVNEHLKQLKTQKVARSIKRHKKHVIKKRKKRGLLI